MESNLQSKSVHKKYTQLLLSLISLLILSPFLQSDIAKIIQDFILFLAIIIIISVFHLRRKIERIFYRLLVLIVLFLDSVIRLNLLPKHFILISFNALVESSFLGIAIYLIIKQIFTESRVTRDTIRGGICVYLLFGFVFAIFFRAIYLLSPQSFYVLVTNYGGFFDSSYFSFLTLTTLGYGDIIPISPLARSLTNIEGIIGIIYPATTIARLVSLYIIHELEDKI
jgi:hypothetical protein